MVSFAGTTTDDPSKNEPTRDVRLGGGSCLRTSAWSSLDPSLLHDNLNLPQPHHEAAAPSCICVIRAAKELSCSRAR
jgi:hypothetical protein